MEIYAQYCEYPKSKDEYLELPRDMYLREWNHEDYADPTGAIKRDAEVRLLRDNIQVFKGKIGSLRRFKDDAKEVSSGMECGIAIAGYGDIKVGDVIEAFSVVKVAAELTTA